MIYETDGETDDKSDDESHDDNDECKAVDNTSR
jgi:hypothetical protein